MTQKSNLQYLREFLAGNEEALEFLSALINEHEDETEELNDKIKELNEKVESLEGQVEELEDEDQNEELCNDQIDFGYGILKFRKPDNLKIQQIIDAWREKLTGVPGHLFS